MARTTSLIIGITAAVAIVTTGLLALRLTGATWRVLFSTIARVFGSDDRNPRWELLMQ
jgi:hypothetical protein